MRRQRRPLRRFLLDGRGTVITRAAQRRPFRPGAWPRPISGQPSSDNSFSVSGVSFPGPLSPLVEQRRIGGGDVGEAQRLGNGEDSQAREGGGQVPEVLISYHEMH